MIADNSAASLAELKRGPLIQVETGKDGKFAAATAIVGVGTTAGVIAIEAREELAKIPHVLPPVAGPEPKVNRSAAEPCFVDDGEPPRQLGVAWIPEALLRPIAPRRGAGGGRGDAHPP